VERLLNYVQRLYQLTEPTATLALQCFARKADSSNAVRNMVN